MVGEYEHERGLYRSVMNDEGMGTGIFLGGSMIGIYVFMSCLRRNPEETRKARSFSSGFFYFRRENRRVDAFISQVEALRRLENLFIEARNK